MKRYITDGSIAVHDAYVWRREKIIIDVFQLTSLQLHLR